jgi:hypothetical protein
MTDTLTELERLHGAAGEPIVAIFDESRVVDFITITVGGVRVDELPESEQDALGRYAIALLNNGSELLKQARLAQTLTSILCTGEGQDVVERAKALARFDKPRAAVGGEYTEGTIAELAQRCEVLIAEEQEKPLPDNALISVLCNTVRLTRECERFPPMGVVNELRAALAAKDAEIERAKHGHYGVLNDRDRLAGELARMKERVAEQRAEHAETRRLLDHALTHGGNRRCSDDGDGSGVCLYCGKPVKP